ncbi:hypothetical protein WDU94_015326 [Cyamophila willieti]
MSNVYVFQQPVTIMRGWVTILVTVTFTTSIRGANYHSHNENVNTFEASGDSSLHISKGQEKILKDFPHLKKDGQKKHGGFKVQDSSGSSISLSSKERSSEDSPSQSIEAKHKKKQQPKLNVWKNYARGKYGVEESVDLSILTKKTTTGRNKVKEKTMKHVKTTHAQTTKSRDKSGKKKHEEEEEEDSRRVHKTSVEYDNELKEKLKQFEKKQSSKSKTEEEMELNVYDANQKREKPKGKAKGLKKKIKEKIKQAKKKSNSDSKTEEQMELDMSDISHKREKGKGKRKSASNSISESESYKFSDSLSDRDKGLSNDYRESEISKFIFQAPPESDDQTEVPKIETPKIPTLTHRKVEEKTKKVTKATATKAKSKTTKAKVSWTDEEEDDYEDEDFEGQTYEGSAHVKHEIKTAKPSEDHEGAVKPKHYSKAFDSDDFNYPSGTEEIKKKIRKLEEKYTADNSSELAQKKKLKKKERKYMHHTTAKGNPNIKGKPTKRPKDKKEHDQKLGKEYKEHEKKLTYTKEERSESAEKDHTRHEGAKNPLEMSTEELMRYQEMANNIESTTTTTMHPPTTEFMKPTTLKPSGTDHWICPSYVKSQTIEIHWSNYDERGEKRINEKPIEAKFRNNMKKFSTKELKGRLRDTQKRGQLKGMPPFDASAALKRVKFHDVFKIDPIDDYDIFRNVTYQPTCSREFEVRMLEKNYRQKYGRRMATAEEQREFAYMLNFIGNNSAALSEDTVNRIQNEEFEKMLACCDTKEVSSIMADFKDSAPQKIAYLKKMGRLPLTTSEEVSKLEREQNSEYRKRMKYKKTHRHRLKLKEGEQIEVLPDENKNHDHEYIANTEEAEQTLVSGEQEQEEEMRNTAALTYFPGGRYINTEELEEMKKENEYYERMKKIGGRITRLYDPKNTLSSAEWAALEATTLTSPRYRNPHRYTNPHFQHTSASVRGRRKRSARSNSGSKESRPSKSRSRSKESSKTGGNKSPNMRKEAGQTKAKEQAANKGENPEDSSLPVLPHTEGLNIEHFMENSQDQWSSIQRNDSEISLDISKQDDITKVTDKRLGKVLDIMKRYQRAEKTNSSTEWENRMANLFVGHTESTPSPKSDSIRSSKTESASPGPDTEILERTKKLKSNINLTMSDELYRALGGPLPYSPHYWPASFLQSSGELEHVRNELGAKSWHDIKAMIKKSMYKLNHTEESFAIDILTTTVPIWKAWLRQTDPQRKIWGHYLNEKHKNPEERSTEDINEMKIINDLKKTLNETTKAKKPTTKKKVTADRVYQQNRNKYDERHKERTERKKERKAKYEDDSFEEKPKRKKEIKPKNDDDSSEEKPKRKKEIKPKNDDDSSEEKPKRKKEIKPKNDDDSSEEKPKRKKEIKPKNDDDSSEEKPKRKKEIKPKNDDNSSEEKPKRKKEIKPKNDDNSSEEKPKRKKEIKPKNDDDSSEEKPKRKKEGKPKYDDDNSEEKPMKQKQKKTKVQKDDKLNTGITPPKISRRDRAKQRDKDKYGSEYSDVIRERKRKYRGSESRSRESRDRSYRKRYESRERRPRGRDREIRGRRPERKNDERRYRDSSVRRNERRYDERRYRDSRGMRNERRHDARRYRDSRERRRYDSRDKRNRYGSRDKSESRKKPRKTDRLRKGRPERFKKKDRKKKRSKREIKYYVSTTTVDPIFIESRSEYQGKIVIDKEWVTRRRAYLAQKHARLDREEKERQLRKKGKLREGQTISTRKPRVDYFDDKDLEQVLLAQGLTKRKAIDSVGIDVEAYEKLENEYIKNKKRFFKDKKSIEDSSDYLEKTKSVDSLTAEEEMIKNIKRNKILKTAKAITNNIKGISIVGQTKGTKQTPFIYTLGSGHLSYIDVSKYNKAEDDYLAGKNITSSSSGLSSYLDSTYEDKDYVTDHNPDYGSLERMQELENNLDIDYKNKEVHFKNSPRQKYSKEDPTLTIPTWPTKKKNRFVRPQDRKLCYFNPSTTNKYRQALYIWHKYNQLKAAHERKENIDEIPSLDSDY